MGNRASLKNVLKNLVDVGNKEQNQQLPPRVFDSLYNITSSFGRSALIKSYPLGSDILLPFIKTKVIPAIKGYVTLPPDYRDMLGRPAITAKKNKTGECAEETKIENEDEFNLAVLKNGCESRPIDMVTQNEWDYRTTSKYKFPTYWNPIGCFFDANKFKVCPYDIGMVSVRYVVDEKIYMYGYINQPDDTYIYDPNTSIESEWNDNAFPFLFKGCLALYADYLRDNQLANASQILNQIGLF